jgi:hypothetical protein
MTKPTILGNATGSTVPNPAYYGFEWPELQAVLDRGQALWDKRREIGRERQALGEEKKRLEADLVKAEAGVALASVGLGDAEIGDAGFALDAPKAQKRLRAIEKRAGELDAQRAGLDLAIQRHKGELENTLMVAPATAPKCRTSRRDSRPSGHASRAASSWAGSSACTRGSLWHELR